ncbi:MAG TPA: FtsQ-type POTRA domain-containing protein [Myxococcota bacterium]
MKKRLAIRWPWKRSANRLGLTRGGFAPVRPERRLVKQALVAGSGVAGVAIGSLFGDLLLARFAPGAAQLVSLEVAGNVHTEPRTLALASGLGADLTLAQIDPEDVSRALELLPWVREARTTKLRPNRVVVSIEERVPVAVARLADGTRLLVDASGVAFAPAPPETRGPELLGLGSVPVASAPHPGLAGGVALLAAWNAAGLPAARAVEIAGELGDDAPAVLIAGRELRVVLGGGDPSEKLARLVRVLALREPELARAVAIDLRFPGQGVLRFAAPCRPREQSLGGGAASETVPGGAASLGGEEQCHAKTT